MSRGTALPARLDNEVPERPRSSGTSPCRGVSGANKSPVGGGVLRGEPKCRLYEKGAPFGAPLIQAMSTLVASWRQQS